MIWGSTLLVLKIPRFYTEMHASRYKQVYKE